MMRSMTFIKLDLWRIWLVIFISVLQFYLIFCTIREYLHVKSLSFDQLYGGNWNKGPMVFQLSCLLCSITFLPLIVITSIIVTGNLSNDGHTLGQDIDNNHFIIDSDSKGQIVLVDLYKSKRTQHNIFCSSQHFIKQQFVPISVFLQILSGFCFLLPLPFIEAQKIEQRVLGTNFLWHTNLDFLIDTDKDHEDFSKGAPFQHPMRASYFNLIFCFSLLSFRYPCVFWRTNRRFALLFYAIIIVLSIHVLIDYSATSILIRLTVPGMVSPDLLPKIHPIAICMISCGGSLILVILQMTVFNYGITQYLSSLAEHRQSLRLQYKSQQSKKSAETEDYSNSSSDSVDIELSDSLSNRACYSIYSRYCAHITAIVLGALAMGMKLPLFMHEWRLYLRTGDKVMHLNLVVSVIFSVMWLITWFGFTLNNSWKFKVNFRSKDEGSVKKSCQASVGGVTCSTIPTTSAHIKRNTTLLGNAGSPVYATCHPSVPLSMNMAHTSPTNNVQSDEVDLLSCYNYVLLHSANTAASGANITNPNVSNYTSIIRQANKSREATSSNFVNVDGNMINADDLYGSEKSSESNFSRSLTAQERTRYSLLPQDVSDGMLNRFLLNRYYSMENPNTKRVPFVRSPLLSYQFSTESSPSEHSRRQITNQPFSRVTFTDQLTGAEPDLIAHKYPIININDRDRRLEMNDLNPSLDQMRIEFLSTEMAKHDFLKDLMASSPTSNNETTIVGGNQMSSKSHTNMTVSDISDHQQSITHDLLMKLNGIDDNNDEEERLCSQV